MAIFSISNRITPQEEIKANKTGKGFAVKMKQELKVDNQFEELKAEIETLKTENEELKATLAEIEIKEAQLKAEIEMLKTKEESLEAEPIEDVILEAEEIEKQSKRKPLV